MQQVAYTGEMIFDRGKEERTATHSMSDENKMLLAAKMLLIIFNDFLSACDVSQHVQIEKIPSLIVQFVERWQTEAERSLSW